MTKKNKENCESILPFSVPQIGELHPVKTESHYTKTGWLLDGVGEGVLNRREFKDNPLIIPLSLRDIQWNYYT